MEASHLKLRSCGGESAVTPKREKTQTIIQTGLCLWNTFKDFKTDLLEQVIPYFAAVSNSVISHCSINTIAVVSRGYYKVNRGQDGK